MQSIGKTAVSTAVRNVELKLATAKDFKVKFEAELNDILVRIEMLKKMLGDNYYDDNTKSGFITIGLENYFEHLKIGQQELESMLQIEIQNWMKNLEKT